MESQKPGDSPGPGPEVVQRQRVPTDQAALRVRSWTVQNQMRDVLGRVPAGAARKIFDFANPKELRAQQQAVCVAAKTKENTTSDEVAQVPRWILTEPLCQRISIRQYASSPRKDKNGYEI